MRNAYFGQGTGPILLDELACTGTERMLINCSSDGLGVTNCLHDEDAGVHCVGKWLMVHYVGQSIICYICCMYMYTTSYLNKICYPKGGDSVMRQT